MSWELFVGLRYLRSRRSEAFVSVITFISIYLHWSIERVASEVVHSAIK